ncbi:MAG: molybdopterin-dependent oxidoreductase, partial [bacterium]|nr:molybdopterin-dependent oxidoreductase [bacterium]
MGDNPMVEEALEPERYELQAEPFYRFELTRRRFFKVFGGGLAIVCLLKDASGQESGEGGVVRATTEQVGGWLHIGEDGTTTVYTGKAEVGQNIRTSLSQAVAEELRLPVSSVKMVMGDTDLTPYDRGTFGSRTTPSMAPQLRRAAAAAREMLLDLASEKWKADRGLLTMVDGKVIHAGTKQVVGFGELTQGMQLMREIRDDEPVIPASRWNTSGKSVPKVNGREIVTGMHRYPSDMRLPGMLYGKMLRPPAFGAKMVSLDA